MSNAIRVIQASVVKMHGDERTRNVKREQFLAFQIAQRQIADGKEASSILKK